MSLGRLFLLWSIPAALVALGCGEVRIENPGGSSGGEAGAGAVAGSSGGGGGAVAGSSGGGAGMGAGGSGGATNGSGGSTSAIPPCASDVNLGPMSFVGFGSSAPDLIMGTMHISSVGPSGMLLVDADGQLWVLSWSGSDLTQFFSADQPVTVNAPFNESPNAQWQIVQSETAFAAAFVQHGDGPAEGPPDLPLGDITFSLGDWCLDHEGPFGFDVYYPLLAKVGDEEISLKDSDSGKVGVLEVSNLGIKARIEKDLQTAKSNTQSVTVLGPLP